MWIILGLEINCPLDLVPHLVATGYVVVVSLFKPNIFFWCWFNFLEWLFMLLCYSPKESSLKNSSSGSYCFVAILLVLFGNFETPTTCAFIVVGGWWWWWWGVFCSMLCPLGNKGFCQVSYGYSKPRIFSSLWLLTNCKFGCRLNFSDIP